MQDRTPLYPGRVKLAPVEGQANVYDMTREDSPTQPGTPLSKATFLKDATAALFGLSSDAVPDDALALLSRFHKGLGNEYVWEKGKVGRVGGVITNYGLFPKFNGYTIQYSESFEQVNGEYKLSGSITTLSSSTTLSATTLNQLAGKYFVTTYAKNLTSDAWDPFYVGKVLFAPQDMSASQISNSSGTLFNFPFYEVGLSVEGYVNSPDHNAYPPAVSDGYIYTPLGQLGPKVRIATGNYVGTGTYTVNNPTVIKLPFKTKVLFIGALYTSGGYTQLDSIQVVWMDRFPEYPDYYGPSNQTKTVTVRDDEVTISSQYGSMYQYNLTNYTYFYIAIG